MIFGWDSGEMGNNSSVNAWRYKDRLFLVKLVVASRMWGSISEHGELKGGGRRPKGRSNPLGQGIQSMGSKSKGCKV